MFMPFDQSVPFESRADFANRIARIQAGGLHTNRTLFVGNEEALALPPGVFIKKRRKSRAGSIFLVMVACGAAMVFALMASANYL